jgi:hypothetical protein
MMKKIITIFILIILSASFLFAQQNEWVWAKNGGGTSTDVGTCVASDNNNNVYVGGYYWVSATFGSTTLSSGSSNYDMFIAKYNASGSLLWAKNYGGQTETKVFGMALDKQGNIVLSGTFSGTASFGDSTYQTNGNNDIFILKLDNQGNIIWSQAYGSTNSEYCPNVTVDQNNNIILGGYYSNTIGVFNYSFTSNGDWDNYVAKFNSNGSLVWARSYGSTKSENNEGIAADQNGNIFITGKFTDSVSFGSLKEAGVNSSDIFTVKLNADGDPVWLKTATGNGGSYPWDIVVDISGNVFVSGTAKDIVNFSSTVSINGNTSACDMFIAKYNNDGECQWAIDDGDGGWCQGFALTTDKVGDVYGTGFFSNSATFGSTSLSGQSQDIFIVKYNSNGVFQYASSGGGYSMDYGNAITVDDNLNPIITGQIREASSFGTNNLTADGIDVLVVKYGQATPPPFTITTQPQNLGICADNDIILNVGASVSGLSYQWKKNGVDINGETDSFIKISNASVSDAGSYSCKVSDGSYDTESAAASVSISDGPEITAQPNKKTIEKGRSVNLIIQATGASPTYQWKKDGVDLNNQTSNIFSIISVEYNDAGTYTCVVTDDCGETETNPITLEVRRPAGIEDEFSGQTELYPNPTFGVLHINVPEEITDYQLDVYNTNGKIVFTKNHLNNSITLNLENIPKGLYYISIKSTLYQLTQPFIKQ